MSHAEQLARKALKLERKTLDRRYSKGEIHYVGFAALPSRMGFMRRMDHAGRNRTTAYREVRQRIGEIARQLEGWPQ